MCSHKICDKKTNDEFLHIVQEDGIWYRKHQWTGLIVLRHDGILRDELEGMMLGKSTRGRRWIHTPEIHQYNTYRIH